MRGSWRGCHPDGSSAIIFGLHLGISLLAGTIAALPLSPYCNIAVVFQVDDRTVCYIIECRHFAFGGVASQGK
jgi:hypothetical protein